MPGKKRSRVEENENSSSKKETKKKRQKISARFIDELLTRFPQVGQKIFEKLDYQSLMNSKQVSKLWYNFLDGQKLLWIETLKKIVKKSQNEYYPFLKFLIEDYLQIK